MIREETVPEHNEPGVDEKWVPESEEERAEMLVILRNSLTVTEKKIVAARKQKIRWSTEYWQSHSKELLLLRRIRQVERQAVSETEEE